MKSVSIQDLKRRLSAFILRVQGGESILITRHRKPVARLTSAEHQHLHIGSRHGSGELEPAVRSGTDGRYLEILTDDRRGEGDD